VAKSPIELPAGASVGQISVEADFQQGLAHISIALPFSVEPIRCDVPLVDYLESAAGITLAMCQIQRAASRARS
jgi:hypothetical protein